MNNIWILAQAENGDTITSEPADQPETQTTETQQVAQDPNQPVERKPEFGAGNWIFLAVIFIFMYFILFRGPKKKQQEHKKMVQNLKKNDRVQTIGGIMGTIVDISENEVTLKVDESNNTKMKVNASAISRNLSTGKDQK